MATSISSDAGVFSDANWKRMVADFNEMRNAQDEEKKEMGEVRKEIGKLKADKADRDRQFMIVGAVAGGTVGAVAGAALAASGVGLAGAVATKTTYALYMGGGAVGGGGIGGAVGWCFTGKK